MISNYDFFYSSLFEEFKIKRDFTDARAVISTKSFLKKTKFVFLFKETNNNNENTPIVFEDQYILIYSYRFVSYEEKIDVTNKLWMKEELTTLFNRLLEE
jgi:hypothetical protein